MALKGPNEKCVFATFPKCIGHFKYYRHPRLVHLHLSGVKGYPLMTHFLFSSVATGLYQFSDFNGIQNFSPLA